MQKNIVTASDSYKFGHHGMLPKDTEYVYSYFESRNGARWDETVFYLLQYIIKEYFIGQVVTKESIDRAEKIIEAHIGPNVFNREGWEYILKEHGGRLPLKIKAVPEGTVVNVSNVLFTVENTDPKCAWLTNFVESILSHVWYGCTVATLSREVKKVIYDYLITTSGEEVAKAAINFCLHDFGYRGASSHESAATGGSAHLLNFMGTDTVPAIEVLMEYYNSDVCAFSVYATEHSVMTARGKAGEFEVVDELLNDHPTGILSVVIDSYNYKRFIETCGTRFKDRILTRDGKFVFRPDSGEPVATSLDVFYLLAENFGWTINNQGYKVLNEKVGILWGDGIDIDGIIAILKAFKDNKIATCNIIFGMGGALLQKVDRDTQRFAFKSSYQVRSGVGYDIYKDPLDSSKVSKKGRLALITMEDGSYKTLEKLKGISVIDRLRVVFLDGELLVDQTLDEMRERAAI
jgi:nicotinamide phosphoribosyltransferase